MKQKRIAESLVRKYKTRNPFRIAEEMGYVIIRSPLKGIRGFYQKISRRHVIYVSSELGDQEARFVCAHEIAHVLLHQGHNRIFTDINTYFVVDKLEIEANRFAVDLLYDDDDLEFFLDHPIQLAANYMGIGIELAEYRLSSIVQARRNEKSPSQAPTPETDSTENLH